jgi:ribosomal protein L35AE/L33A
MVYNSKTNNHLSPQAIDSRVLNTNNANRNHNVIKVEDIFNNSKTVLHVNKQLNYHDNKDGAYCRNIA